MKVSICIPTFNRAANLSNCLNSIIKCSSKSPHKFQVCVSDNNSTDETMKVVKNAQSYIDIKYIKNRNNLGIAGNFVKVVSIADGDFIWLIGDDDLLMPYAIGELFNLINSHPEVDFFYVNSFNLPNTYLSDFPSPFDTDNLPTEMETFSGWRAEGELPFLDLINPHISFDFLGGMFLSVFRRKNWVKYANIIDKDAILDIRTFSHFDNTFPHVKIFARAFSKSNAYFNYRPLCVNLSGVREWSSKSSLINSVRLIEALKFYLHEGLPYWKYVYCKNFALRNFIPDFFKIFLYKETSGFYYIRPLKIIRNNCLYPNFYFSLFYFLFKKIVRLINTITNFIRL